MEEVSNTEEVYHKSKKDSKTMKGTFLDFQMKATERSLQDLTMENSYPHLEMDIPLSESVLEISQIKLPPNLPYSTMNKLLIHSDTHQGTAEQKVLITNNLSNDRTVLPKTESSNSNLDLTANQEMFVFKYNDNSPPNVNSRSTSEGFSPSKLTEVVSSASSNDLNSSNSNYEDILLNHSEKPKDYLFVPRSLTHLPVTPKQVPPLPPLPPLPPAWPSYSPSSSDSPISEDNRAEYKSPEESELLDADDYQKQKLPTPEPSEIEEKKGKLLLLEDFHLFDPGNFKAFQINREETVETTKKISKTHLESSTSESSSSSSSSSSDSSSSESSNSSESDSEENKKSSKKPTDIKPKKKIPKYGESKGADVESGGIYAKKEKARYVNDSHNKLMKEKECIFKSERRSLSKSYKSRFDMYNEHRSSSNYSNEHRSYGNSKYMHRSARKHSDENRSCIKHYDENRNDSKHMHYRQNSYGHKSDNGHKSDKYANDRYNSDKYRRSEHSEKRRSNISSGREIHEQHHSIEKIGDYKKDIFNSAHKSSESRLSYNKDTHDKPKYSKSFSKYRNDAQDKPPPQVTDKTSISDGLFESLREFDQKEVQNALAKKTKSKSEKRKIVLEESDEIESEDLIKNNKKQLTESTKSLQKWKSSRDSMSKDTSIQMISDKQFPINNMEDKCDSSKSYTHETRKSDLSDDDLEPGECTSSSDEDSPPPIHGPPISSDSFSSTFSRPFSEYDQLLEEEKQRCSFNKDHNNTGKYTLSKSKLHHLGPNRENSQEKSMEISKPKYISLRERLGLTPTKKDKLYPSYEQADIPPTFNPRTPPEIEDVKEEKKLVSFSREGSVCSNESKGYYSRTSEISCKLQEHNSNNDYLFNDHEYKRTPLLSTPPIQEPSSSRNCTSYTKDTDDGYSIKTQNTNLLYDKKILSPIKPVKESPVRVNLESRIKDLFGLKNSSSEDSPVKKNELLPRPKMHRPLARPPSPFVNKNSYLYWYKETYLFKKHNKIGSYPCADPTVCRKIGIQIKEFNESSLPANHKEAGRGSSSKNSYISHASSQKSKAVSFLDFDETTGATPKPQNVILENSMAAMISAGSPNLHKTAGTSSNITHVDVLPQLELELYSESSPTDSPEGSTSLNLPQSPTYRNCTDANNESTMLMKLVMAKLLQELKRSIKRQIADEFIESSLSLSNGKCHIKRHKTE